MIYFIDVNITTHSSTFSNGYTVFWQAAHLSWVPEKIEDILFGAFDCEKFRIRNVNNFQMSINQ
jgi:hypothetical protein